MAVSRMQILLTVFISVGVLRDQTDALAVCAYVNGSTDVEADSCLSFTEALGLVNQDNVQLLLESGDHILQNTSMPVITGLTGVSLIGLGVNSTAVRIICQDNVGFVFMRMSRLTIQNVSLVRCSTGVRQLDSVQRFARDNYEQVINIPDRLTSSVLIVDGFDVSITSVTVSNTTGIGVVGLNLMGETRISEVEFYANEPAVEECPNLNINDEATGELIGGGLYLLYQDYTQQNLTSAIHDLTISNCEFHGNRDCSENWVSELFHGIARSRQLEYSFGGGGGLTILTAQNQYTVRGSIRNSVFKQNSAKFGSGAHVGFFTGSGDNVVNFYGCTFSNNGKLENPYSGGGLAVLTDLVLPRFSRTNREDSNGSVVTIVNTHFIENQAYFGGGLYMLARSRGSQQETRFTIQDSSFRWNAAPVAAAMVMTTRSADVFRSQFYVEIRDTYFEKNIANFDISREDDEIVGVCLLFRGVQVTLSGNTSFYHNFGTALACSSTHTFIDGDITIANTTAFDGSLRLSDLSTVTLKQNSVLRFLGNSAPPYGGAIYEASQGSVIRYSQEGCFLFFQEINLLPQVERCPDFTKLNATLVFDGNSALTGTNLYGSTLESCNWADCLRNSTEKTVFKILEDMNIIRVLNRDNTSQILEVSTPPFEIRLLNYTEQHVMPGEVFNVNMLVEDELGQSVFSGLGAVLFSRFGEGIEQNAQVRLGPNGFWFIDRSPDFTGSSTPVSITGPENKQLTVTLGTLEEGSSAFKGFNVTLTSCLLGFKYNTTTQSCECETLFSLYPEVGLICDPRRAVITVPGIVWLGPIMDDNFTTFGYTETCFLNYCEPGPVNITKENFNRLCRAENNREGVGCGQCRANFSVTFGSNVCLQCSNNYLFLIFVFAFTGVGTIAVLSILRQTISEGYLNSILFYANIVNLFAFYFRQATSFTGFLAPLSWISQTLGVQTCFYDGMTTLAAYALRFVYILYLFILMGLVILIAKFVQLPGSYIYSPTKVLATLLILCYTSLLEACVSIFSFTFVYTNDGRTLTRWFYDPNVVYFEGLHGFLFALALVISIVFLIPFPLLTLTPRLVLRFQCLSNFKPLLDPFWAPLKPKFEWWVSFRLFFRWFPVFISSFVPVPLNIFILGLLVLCLLFTQMKLQPFEGTLRNTLDDLLVANIVFLVIGFLYFFCVDQLSGISANSLIFVCLAYIIILVTAIVHFSTSHPNLRNRVIKWIQQKVLKRDTASKQNGEIHDNEDIPSNPMATHSEVAMSPRREGSVRFAAPDASGELNDHKYTRYRESLLADEDEERPSGILDTLRSIELETAV